MRERERKLNNFANMKFAQFQTDSIEHENFIAESCVGVAGWCGVRLQIE